MGRSIDLVGAPKVLGFGIEDGLTGYRMSGVPSKDEFGGIGSKY